MKLLSVVTAVVLFSLCFGMKVCPLVPVEANVGWGACNSTCADDLRAGCVRRYEACKSRLSYPLSENRPASLMEKALRCEVCDRYCLKDSLKLVLVSPHFAEMNELSEFCRKEYIDKDICIGKFSDYHVNKPIANEISISELM